MCSGAAWPSLVTRLRGAVAVLVITGMIDRPEMKPQAVLFWRDAIEGAASGAPSTSQVRQNPQEWDQHLRDMDRTRNALYRFFPHI